MAKGMNKDKVKEVNKKSKTNGKDLRELARIQDDARCANRNRSRDRMTFSDAAILTISPFPLRL